MVRLRTSLRVMPAIWLGAPLAVLAVAYGFALYPSDLYGLGATAMGSAVLPFVGGFTAATAAWEGARLRRTVWASPVVRSRVVIAGWAVFPSVLVGLAAVLVATIVMLIRSEATTPDLRILAVAALDLVAWSVVGFALGIRLPVPVAVPTAILLPFIWFAFVPALQPEWLRHITGMFRDCCGISEDLSPVAVLASLLADIGILLAAVLAIGGRASRTRVGASVVALVVPFAAAVALVAGMTYAPVIPRDAALLDCRTSSGLTVCVWPEHSPMADQVLAEAVAVRERWAAAGVDSPPLITEQGRADAPVGALHFDYNGAAPEEVLLSLAAGLTPQAPYCDLGSTGAIAQAWLEPWYASAGGLSAASLVRVFETNWEIGGTTLDPVPTVEALWRVSPEARQAWVAHAVWMIGTCDEVVQDMTVRP